MKSYFLFPLRSRFSPSALRSFVSQNPTQEKNCFCSLESQFSIKSANWSSLPTARAARANTNRGSTWLAQGKRDLISLSSFGSPNLGWTCILNCLWLTHRILKDLWTTAQAAVHEADSCSLPFEKIKWMLRILLELFSYESGDRGWHKALDKQRNDRPRKQLWDFPDETLSTR